MKEINNSPQWKHSDARTFWGEIAPCDHVLQVYEDDNAFLDVLDGFVEGGIRKDECVVVIGTEVHLEALMQRLMNHGFDVARLIKEDVYIPLDAEASLRRFMVNGWPDENLFRIFVTDLLHRAHSRKRQVRAFGEMVAVLWTQGLSGATVRLENLWNQFCSTENFCLFCAYPKSGFTQDAVESLENICSTHSKLVGGWNKSTTQIFYRSSAISG